MSEVLLSKVFENKDSRFDTDFWTKEPKINPLLKYMRIGDCLKVSQYGISISMNEEEKGIPIYRMNEIHNMLCDFSVSKYADITEKELETFRLNDRDVLFNRTNSFEWVGRTGIFYEQSKQDFIFASYLVRFVPNEEIILPEYLTTYLNTKYGIWDLKRRARQSINQTNINPEEVKESLIPILEKELQLKIKSNFDISKNKLHLSQHKYTQAENLLLETLQLKDFQPKNEAVNIKSLKESFLQTGRLDAEFYQKKYEAIEHKIQNYIEGFARLGEICTLKDTNFTPDDNTEYAYIELSNIGNSGEITGCTYDLGKNLPTRARRKVSENDVMISSIEGSLKSCVIVPKAYDNALCSTGFYVIASEQINSETLLVLFKSELMQQILKKNCSGTILTAINKEEFLNIPIPMIGKKYQQEIAEYIQKANQLRTEAQSLLQDAKLSVENAIESQLAENQNISGGGVNRLKSINYEILYYERLAQWTLYEALFGLAENRFSHLNIAVQTLQNSFVKTGRLDAEYYQPKYEQLIQKLKNHTCDKLKNMVDIKKSIEPGSVAYDTEGVPFIRVSDYSKFGLSTPDKYLSETYYRENQKTLDRLKPQKDTILFSKDGSVGIAYQLTEDLQGITSGAILHLQVKNKKEILPEYLTLVLNSLVVQMQADRDVGGSIIQHWRVNEIEEVIIPVVSREIQQKIALLIQESFTLKQESEGLLQQAKQMVEAEIEKRYIC